MQNLGPCPRPSGLEPAFYQDPRQVVADTVGEALAKPMGLESDCRDSNSHSDAHWLCALGHFT